MEVGERDIPAEPFTDPGPTNDTASTARPVATVARSDIGSRPSAGLFPARRSGPAAALLKGGTHP